MTRAIRSFLIVCILLLPLTAHAYEVRIKTHEQLFASVWQLKGSQGEYVMHHNDCSNMTAMVFTELRRQGYQAYIVTGWLVNSTGHTGEAHYITSTKFHAMVLVFAFYERRMHPFWIEPTTMQLLHSNGMFYPDRVFDSVEAAQQVYGEKEFEIR